MTSISIRQVVDTFIELNLGPKYQSLKKKHDKLEKICLDVFAHHGIEISLDDKEKQKSFLCHILQMQAILKKLKETVTKAPRYYFLDDVFPVSAGVFYSEATHPNASYIVKPPERYYSYSIPHLNSQNF